MSHSGTRGTCGARSFTLSPAYRPKVVHLSEDKQCESGNQFRGICWASRCSLCSVYGFCRSPTFDSLRLVEFCLFVGHQKQVWCIGKKGPGERNCSATQRTNHNSPITWIFRCFVCPWPLFYGARAVTRADLGSSQMRLDELRKVQRFIIVIHITFEQVFRFALALMQ